MKKSNYLKFLYGIVSILIILIVGILYSLNNSQSFSILSADKVQVGANGQWEWVIFANTNVANSGSSYKFVKLAKNLPTTTDTNGGTIKPTKNIKLNIDLNQISCGYTLQDNEGVYVYGDYDYNILAMPESIAKTTISDGTTTKTIDALSNKQVNFKDGNGGYLTVSPQGYLGGKYSCPELSQFTIGVPKGKNNVNFYKTGTFIDSNVNPLVKGMTCKVGVINNGKINSVKTQKMTCVLNSNLPTLNPTFTLTANAKYLDFVYIPPTIGVPKILSVVKPPKIVEASSNSISVKVQNTGKDSGIFVLYAISDAFTFIPTSTAPFKMNAGETIEQSFTMYAPNIIPKVATFDNSFKLCSLNQFGQGQCNDKPYSLDVNGKSIFDKIINSNGGNTCGNNVCDKNENYQTCSSDCDIPLVCDGQFMSKQNNKCVCDTGYTITPDTYGGQYCKQDKSNTLLILGILSVVFVIISIMIIVAKRRRK